LLTVVFNTVSRPGIDLWVHKIDDQVLTPRVASDPLSRGCYGAGCGDSTT